MNTTLKKKVAAGALVLATVGGTLGVNGMADASGPVNPVAVEAAKQPSQVSESLPDVPKLAVAVYAAGAMYTLSATCWQQLGQVARSGRIIGKIWKAGSEPRLAGSNGRPVSADVIFDR